MVRTDVLVVGGGVAGACFAHHAAEAGRRVVVVERERQPGGCLASERGPETFWLELGAHTAYNSYGALLEVLEARGLLPRLQPRGKPVLRFLDGDRVLPGANLGALLRRFRKLELLRALPRWFRADPHGVTAGEHYARLVGPTNYERVLGPMLSALPSQRADELPADFLFKKRERRRDVRRSFTLPGGLRTAVVAVLDRPEIDVRAGREATALERAGSGFAASLTDGERIEADVVALAVPPGAAAALLRGVSPDAAAAAGRVREASADSLGCAVSAERVALPYTTFLIPLDDVFHSVVTRDVVPDPTWRGFTFHFRPGLSREARLRRASEVLGVPQSAFEAVHERTHVLPAPRLGHRDLVAEVDRALAGERLAVTGNWLLGLSIEDCAQRSRAEWQRVGAAS